MAERLDGLEVILRNTNDQEIKDELQWELDVQRAISALAHAALELHLDLRALGEMTATAMRELTDGQVDLLVMPLVCGMGQVPDLTPSCPGNCNFNVCLRAAETMKPASSFSFDDKNCDHVCLCVPSVAKGRELVAIFRVLGSSVFSERQINACESLADIYALGTQRVQAEQAAELEQSRSRAYFDTAALIMVVLDCDMRILALNRYAAHLLGVSEADVLGENWVERFVPQAEQQIVQEAISAFISGVSGEAAYRANSLISADGQIRKIAWHNARFYDSEGQVLYLVASGNDVTDQILAEDALRDSEFKFRSLFEQSRDGLLTMDANQRIETANDAFLSMVALDSDQVLDRVLTDLIPPSWRQTHKRHFDQVLSGIDRIEPYEIELLRNQGTTIPVSMTLWSEKDATGHIVRFVASARDISVRQRLERQLRESSRMEAIGRLAGGIAHDFNNLLMIINNCAAFVAERTGEDDPVMRDVLDILQAGQRAADLTQQLLAFGRQQVLEMTPLQINNIVLDTIRMLERVLGEDVSLQVELDEDVPTVLSDRGQISEILINLAINAREAMPRGGKLIIKTGMAEIQPESRLCAQGVKPGGYVYLSMADTGVGMLPEIREHIFEPFFTTKQTGTGLGLATVYGIVTQMGGAVDVQSTVGEGTIITLHLPVHRGEIEETLPDAPVSVRSHEGRVILLVEDSPSVRTITTRMLRSVGYVVIEKQSPQEALRIVKGGLVDIDLVLTDVVMPDLDGTEFAIQLAEIEPRLPILFMSGYTDSALKRYGAEFRHTSLINKPFTRTSLIEHIERAISQLEIEKDIER